MIWQRTNAFDIAVSRLADKHYNRQTIGARQFSPNGQKIVLYIPAADWPFHVAAAWVWHRPHPDKAQRMDGYDGFYNNSLFRNESTYLSSDLIKEAIQWAIDIWGLPSKGFDTYVWPEKLRQPEHQYRKPKLAGYCYLKAGWHDSDQWTKDHKKKRLYFLSTEVTA